jgi:hypothetical protein
MQQHVASPLLQAFWRQWFLLSLNAAILGRLAPPAIAG